MYFDVYKGILSLSHTHTRSISLTQTHNLSPFSVPFSSLQSLACSKECKYEFFYPLSLTHTNTSGNEERNTKKYLGQPLLHKEPRQTSQRQDC